MSALKRHPTYLLPGASSDSDSTAMPPPPAPLSRAASHGIIRSAVPEHPRLRNIRHQDAGTGASWVIQPTVDTQPAQERQRSPSPSPEEDWPVPWELYSNEIPRTIMGNSEELVFVAWNSHGEEVSYPLKPSRSYLDILMRIIVLFMFTVMLVDFTVNGRYNFLSVF
ncbi:hypothetical protein BDZ89DRAFT_1069880 [Hymenopellis radicata]|nr:hypothetical protein BDZ89DRAFT_1069880 [Hymenopellis radicata]